MLIASITAGRTGRMGNVIATIQAEQDRVIRASLQGVLVVQGGPGTGKTVAALHRAAYLLYTHRRTLERRGVLVIGPNSTFLRYISQVLPSLGETDVVLSSIAELFPGVKAAADDNAEAAVVKGDLKMVNVLRRAVRNRQQVPPGDLAVTADGVRMTVPTERVLRARDRARALRKPHNVARKLFATEMLSALAVAEADALGRQLDPEDLPYARARLWDEPPVRAAVDELWPFLTPQRLVAGLLAEEGALRRPPRVFLRPNGPPSCGRITPMPGRWRTFRCWMRPRSCSAPTTRRKRRGAGPPSGNAGPRKGTPGRCSRSPAWPARGSWTPPRSRTGTPIRGRQSPRPNGLGRSLLGLRPRDRGRGAGAFRHGLADGDAADPHPVDHGRRGRGPAGERGGAQSWAEMLDPYVRGKWHEELLTVNYRPRPRSWRSRPTCWPRSPGQRPPESVREEGFPRAVRGLARTAAVVAEELAEIDAERGGAAGSRRSRPARGWRNWPGHPRGRSRDRPRLDSPVALLTVIQAKGLEFDRVVLVDPAGILAQSP